MARHTARCLLQMVLRDTTWVLRVTVPHSVHTHLPVVWCNLNTCCTESCFHRPAGPLDTLPSPWNQADQPAVLLRAIAVATSVALFFSHVSAKLTRPLVSNLVAAYSLARESALTLACQTSRSIPKATARATVKWALTLLTCSGETPLQILPNPAWISL